MDSCCFCLQDIEDKQSSSILKCNHIFHTICLTQYKNNTCPLCRGDKKVIEEKKFICDINDVKYSDDNFVWIFGSFHIGTIRQNCQQIVCKINGKQFVSGYFYRLFNNETSKILEEHYQKYLSDKSSNNKSYNIEIGSSDYIIQFDKFDTIQTFNIPNTSVMLQLNQYGMYRPIIRIKWKDVMEYLLVIGIHDNMFFGEIYTYHSPNKILLFNLENQIKINNHYKQSKIIKAKIIINGNEYTINKNTNVMYLSNNSKDKYNIYKFDKNVKVCNY